MLKKELEQKLLASEEAIKKLRHEKDTLAFKLRKCKSHGDELTKAANENLILTQNLKRLRVIEKKFETGIKEFCKFPWYKKIFYTDEDVFAFIKNIESK